MPTKRMFDMVIITVLLAQPVKGLFRMVATRKSLDPSSPLGQIVGGAVTIAS